MNSILLSQLQRFFIFFFIINSIHSFHSIDDYGGIKFDTSDQASSQNSLSLLKTIIAANSSLTDKIVLIPENSNYTFFYFFISNVYNIIIEINGVLLINNNVKSDYWPKVDNDGGHFAAIKMEYCQNIEFRGKGLIDGQGFNFWLYTIEHGFDYRPHMMIINRTSDLRINGLRFWNSPQWHLYINDCLNVIIEKIEIYVDVEGQKRILKQNGRWDYLKEIPTFPLNTDGIDPSGRNFIIRNVKMTNYDDGVAVKPSNQKGYFSKCSQDMYISDASFKYSLGLAIGSLSPSKLVNCIRNITFKNCYFEDSLKTIYIKPNPPTFTPSEGTGIIEKITFENIYVKRNLWMPIWIGPQQMHEPGKNGTGCSFFYPMVGKCIPQPLVTIQDILLKNVTFVESELIPGVILADEKNPFKNIIFENVRNDGMFLMKNDYVSQNVVDCYVIGDTHPIPKGFIKKGI